MTSPAVAAVTRRIADGHSAEAAGWAREGQELVEAFEGFLGSAWIRDEASASQWHMVFRFETAEHLDSWTRSDVRRAWAERGAQYVESAEFRPVSGWFDDLLTPVPVEQRATPRWKQMCATFLVFFPLSLATNMALSLSGLVLETWLRVLITVVVMTPVMTYWALPLAGRMLAPWLSAAPRQQRRPD